MVLYHKIRKMLLQIAKKSKRHENRPQRIAGAAGDRSIKEKERIKRPVPAGRGSLFGDDLEHLFVALLGDGYSVREQRLALLAALVAERLVL